MKAILCKQWGPPENLVVENIPILKAAKAHVIINVKACGVNFPDTLIIQGKYQYKPDLPFSPGAEIAGIIKELGQGVSGVGVGDRVFAFIGWGGFAEEVLVPVEKIIHMPEGMEFKTASAFVMTYGTSYYALKHRAQLKSGETLLVLGAAGGVGLAAVELGKIMGARVIASASSDDKLAVCKEYGADELINYSTQNFRSIIREITNGQGVDVVCDPVGVEVKLEKWKTGVKEPPHSHPGDDMTVVIEGRMSIQFFANRSAGLIPDEDRIFLNKGQTGYIKCGRIHDTKYIEECKLVYVHDRTFGFIEHN